MSQDLRIEIVTKDDNGVPLRSPRALVEGFDVLFGMDETPNGWAFSIAVGDGGSDV